MIARLPEPVYTTMEVPQGCKDCGGRGWQPMGAQRIVCRLCNGFGFGLRAYQAVHHYVIVPGTQPPPKA
jgi:hypothetical protein